MLHPETAHDDFGALMRHAAHELWHLQADITGCAQKGSRIRRPAGRPTQRLHSVSTIRPLIPLSLSPQGSSSAEEDRKGRCCSQGANRVQIPVKCGSGDSLRESGQLFPDARMHSAAERFATGRVRLQRCPDTSSIRSIVHDQPDCHRPHFFAPAACEH